MTAVARQHVIKLISVVACWLLTAQHVAGEGRYDPDLGYRTLVYNSAAYSPELVVHKWTFPNQDCNNQTQGFRVLKTFYDPITTAFAYMGRDDEARQLVVSFKGTNGTHDWLYNLRSTFHYYFTCEIEDSDLGRVHCGFCEYYKALDGAGLLDTLMETWMDERYREYTLLVTGHSLGGAMAGLLASHVVSALKSGGRIDRARHRTHTRIRAHTHSGVRDTHLRMLLYTMGEPRVGDASFSKIIDDAIADNGTAIGVNATLTVSAFRLVHDRDPVPHLPLCCEDRRTYCSPIPTCPYHHATEVWYDEQRMSGDGTDKFEVCDETGEDPECSDHSPIDLNIPEHKRYFGVDVGLYCQQPLTTHTYTPPDAHTHTRIPPDAHTHTKRVRARGEGGVGGADGPLVGVQKEGYVAME